LLSDRPAAYRPTAATTTAKPSQPIDRRLVLGGVILMVVVLVVVGVVLLLNSGNSPSGSNRGGAAGGATSSTESPRSPTSGSTATTPAGPPLGQAASSGNIQYTPAGEKVIEYYSGNTPTDTRWNDLTPAAQALFGGTESAFSQYWSKYPQVSSRNAFGVTRNAADGSVMVPIDVSGTPGNTEHKVLRVVMENGNLLIDADTRI
jgi:hypothetical protein